MVALKAINLSSFSLSRTASPSRSPPAAASAPPSSSSSSNPSSNPSTRPSSMDSKAGDAVQVELVTAVAEGGMSRRQSFGAISTLGAALRRSSSFRSTTPNPAAANLALSTPVATIFSATASSARPHSDSRLPPRHSAADPVLATKHRAKSTSKTRPHANSIPPRGSTSNLIQAHSQPPMTRQHSHGPGGKLTPAAMTPGGAHTPVGSKGPGVAPPMHNLEESYVGNVSLRLGDAVNKVFMPPPGPIPATEVFCNGRCPPRWQKSRELGELIVHELRAALHDTYLLRTLFRSTISRSLSFFLTRLSALPIACDAFAPTTAKDLDYAHLPLALRFNLQVVRCAYELKYALSSAPISVEDTLVPWKDKLDELVARIMGPLVVAFRGAVIGICARARTVEAARGPHGATAVSGGAMMLDAATASVKAAAASSHALAALGRVGPAATPVGGVGPPWIRDLAAFLGAVEKLVHKLECGADADKWLVGVGTCAVWKGLLALSARKLVEEAPAPVVVASGTMTAAKGLFKSAAKVAKTTPSPPESPTLHAAPLDSAVPACPTTGAQVQTAVSDVAFIRLIGELELFEARLTAFTAALSVAPAAPKNLMSGQCAELAPCGLCKTGRQFDAKAPDDDDDDEDDPDPTGARGLAQCAMREALQALSAVIVVVRASGGKWSLKDALLVSAGRDLATRAQQPMTPAAQFRAPALATLDDSIQPPCPTLLHALDTIPVLLLLHILVSRLPPTVPFRLPHELWGLEWKEYESELRGFAAAEEWTPELGWEMANEVERCENVVGLGVEARARLSLLRVAIESRGVGADA